MSSNHQCPGLINLSDEYSDKVPLRVAVYKGCYFTSVEIFNIIIKALKRPFVMKHCDSYDWPGNSIINNLVDNNSDFSPNMADVNIVRYQKILYTPSLSFANAITILSGKILANNGNGFSILSSFSTELWLLLGAILVVIAICNRSLHKEYSKWTLYLMGVVRHFIKLYGVFINQSNQFGNICCVKHLILNSFTIISLFVMTLFFSSEILSKLLFHPLVKIDTLDDLVNYINQHDDVKIISENLTSPWNTMKS